MRIFLLPFFVIISCSSIENETNMHSRAGLPDQESWDVEITLTDEGVIKRRKEQLKHIDHMNKLDKYIHNHYRNSEKKIGVKQIIISTSTEVGEGEHKIFQFKSKLRATIRKKRVV